MVNMCVSYGIYKISQALKVLAHREPEKAKFSQLTNVRVYYSHVCISHVWYYTMFHLI